MLHFVVESAFEDLLATWRAHQAIQDRTTRSFDDAHLAKLATSRQSLDRARTRMHQLRMAVYPENHEIESIVESVWCESYETVVHLRWVDQHPTKPGNFVCTCGHLVPINWGHATK